MPGTLSSGSRNKKSRQAHVMAGNFRTDHSQVPVGQVLHLVHGQDLPHTSEAQVLGPWSEWELYIDQGP